MKKLTHKGLMEVKRLDWEGHTIGMKDTRIVKKIYMGRPGGKSSEQVKIVRLCRKRFKELKALEDGGR